MSGITTAQLITFAAPADWLEANSSGTESAALLKAAHLREAAVKSMHISSQIARRVAQTITLESAAERSEAAGLPKAAQLFINVQDNRLLYAWARGNVSAQLEGCVMKLPLSGTSFSPSCSELENVVASRSGLLAVCLHSGQTDSGGSNRGSACSRPNGFSRAAYAVEAAAQKHACWWNGLACRAGDAS